MGTFMLIAKTVLCSVVAAGALAALTVKIATMISPSHAHLGVALIIIVFAGYAVVAAFVCSLIGSLVWRNSLDENWLKIVMGAVAIGESIVLGFIIYGAMKR